MLLDLINIIKILYLKPFLGNFGPFQIMIIFFAIFVRRPIRIFALLARYSLSFRFHNAVHTHLHFFFLFQNGVIKVFLRRDEIFD